MAWSVGTGGTPRTSLRETLKLDENQVSRDSVHRVPYFHDTPLARPLWVNFYVRLDFPTPRYRFFFLSFFSSFAHSFRPCRANEKLPTESYDEHRFVLSDLYRMMQLRYRFVCLFLCLFAFFFCFCTVAATINAPPVFLSFLGNRVSVIMVLREIRFARSVATQYVVRTSPFTFGWPTQS